MGVDNAGYCDSSHDDVGHNGGGYKKVDRDKKLVRYYDVHNLDRPKEQDDDYNEVAYDGADEFDDTDNGCNASANDDDFFGGMVGPKQARTTEKHREILGRKNSS